MKNQIFCFLLATLFSLQTAFGQDKGYITLTQSETATTATYDGAVAKLKEAGVWEMDWTFHAAGTKQPTGLMSLGVYADKASLDRRVAKTAEVFKTNNINVPAPTPYEVYSIFREGLPKAMPATAILVHSQPTGMTAEHYNKIVEELTKAGALANSGQLFHIAYKNADGNLSVVDVWESAEKFQAFGKTLVPILEKTLGSGGTSTPPAVYGVYNTVIK